MKRHLASLWESVVDGVVDMNSHRSRSVLQLVGIVLGVASVVATFGMIDGGKRKMTEFFEQTGAYAEMRNVAAERLLALPVFGKVGVSPYAEEDDA